MAAATRVPMKAWNGATAAEAIDPADVEQHDHEEEEHQDRARVDDDLDGGQEVHPEQGKDGCHGEEHHHQREDVGHGISGDHRDQSEEDRDGCCSEKDPGHHRRSLQVPEGERDPDPQEVERLPAAS